MRPPIELVGGPWDGAKFKDVKLNPVQGGHYQPVEGTNFYRWVPD